MMKIEQARGLKKIITEADNICKAVGDGWRLPNANELILSYVYRDALGGDANQGSGYAGQNIFGWFADRIGLHRSILLIQIHVLQWTSQVV